MKEKLPVKLYHYTRNPNIQLRNDYLLGIARMRLPGKPRGFWFGVEDDPEETTWRDFCNEERFRVDHVEFKYLITLKDTAKILCLKTPEEMKQFSFHYKNDDPDLHGISIPFHEVHSVYAIDWQKVSEEYDGIIIPKQMNHAFFESGISSWYFGWDVASGCIWNLDAIESLILQQEAPV